jgi:hypothetical protein
MSRAQVLEITIMPMVILQHPLVLVLVAVVNIFYNIKYINPLICARHTLLLHNR